MKRKVFGAIIAMTLIGSVTLLGGCATMGGQKVAKAPTEELQRTQDDMKQAIVKIDATTASLKTLIEPDQVALKSAFDEYKEHVQQMESVSNRIDENVNELRSEGREYFSELRQQELSYTDPKLRQASSERRTKLDDLYVKVPQTTNQFNEALHAYMVDLKQIQTYISTHLTPVGVEAIRPIAEGAIKKGQNVQELAHPAITATAQAITIMTPGSTGAAAGGQQ